MILSPCMQAVTQVPSALTHRRLASSIRAAVQVCLYCCKDWKVSGTITPRRRSCPGLENTTEPAWLVGRATAGLSGLQAAALLGTPEVPAAAQPAVTPAPGWAAGLNTCMRGAAKAGPCCGLAACAALRTGGGSGSGGGALPAACSLVVSVSAGLGGSPCGGSTLFACTSASAAGTPAPWTAGSSSSDQSTELRLCGCTAANVGRHKLSFCVGGAVASFCGEALPGAAFLSGAAAASGLPALHVPAGIACTAAATGAACCLLLTCCAHAGASPKACRMSSSAQEAQGHS